MNYLKIEKKYRNNCLKASQAEGREFESRLPLPGNHAPIGFSGRCFSFGENSGKANPYSLPHSLKINNLKKSYRDKKQGLFKRSRLAQFW